MLMNTPNPKDLQLSTQVASALLNAADNPIMVLDATGYIVRFNHACEQISGYEAGDVQGRPFWDVFLAESERDSARQKFERYKAPPPARWIARDGATIPGKWGATQLRDDAGKLQCIVCAIQGEASSPWQEALANERQRDNETRSTLALRGTNDGVWDWNLVSDTIYFSPRWKAMSNYGEGDIGNRPNDWLGRVHAADVAQVRVAITQHLKGETPYFESAYRLMHPDGSYRWMQARGQAVRDERDTALRMVGTQTDITKYKVAEQQLLHDVLYDTLTGLPNRLLFLERVDQILTHTRQNEELRFAVLFLDFDDFKTVNDALGLALGDQLLKAIAGRLKGCLRRDDSIARESQPLAPNPSLDAASSPDSVINLDMVARLSGDEFAVVLEDIHNSAAARRVAERIRTELERPFNLSGHVVRTTLSLGIVLSSPSHRKPNDIVRQADVAMYKAKASGKGQSRIFEAEEQMSEL